MNVRSLKVISPGGCPLSPQRRVGVLALTVPGPAGGELTGLNKQSGFTSAWSGKRWHCVVGIVSLAVLVRGGDHSPGDRRQCAPAPDAGCCFINSKAAPRLVQSWRRSEPQGLKGKGRFPPDKQSANFKRLKHSVSVTFLSRSGESEPCVGGPSIGVVGRGTALGETVALADKIIKQTFRY